MTVAEISREREPRREKAQVDRNAGLRGGWCYSLIDADKSLWMTGWLEQYFDEENP